MGFGEAIGSGFRNYARFEGRSTRSEFWWWTLFVWLLNIGLATASGLLGPGDGQNATPTASAALGVIGLAQVGFSLATMLPSIAVKVRRLHDTDHSGWWYFLPITVIGAIPFFIWMCSRGTPGANAYGYDSRADIAGVFGDGAVRAALRDQRS